MGHFPTGGGSGGGAVSSVFTRTGAVVATTGDYTAAQVGADASGVANTLAPSNVVALTSAVNYNANIGDLCVLTGALAQGVVTAPATASLGQSFAVMSAQTGGGGLTTFAVTPSAGQTVNGSSTAYGLIEGAPNFGGPFYWKFTYVATNTWVCTQALGTDAGSGVGANGPLSLNQPIYWNTTRTITSNGPWTMNSTDGFIARTTGANPGTLTLVNPEIGQMLFVVNRAPGPIVLSATTLVGVSVIPSKGGALLYASGANSWQTVAAWGCNQDTYVAPSNPSITSGVGFIPSKYQDCDLYVPVVATTTGTVAITMGPTTGSENTPYPSQNLLVGMGQTLDLKVPAGWTVIATITGVTVAFGTATVIPLS
jgi:hypothetical protein